MEDFFNTGEKNIYRFLFLFRRSLSKWENSNSKQARFVMLWNVCVCVYVYIYTYTIFFMLHGKVYTSNIDKRICVNGKDISFKVMISKLKTFRGILVDKL